MVVEVVATAAVAMVAGRGGGGKGVEVTKAVKVVAVEMAAVTPDISDWGSPGWRSIPTSNGTHIGSNQRARTHLRNPGCLDSAGPSLQPAYSQNVLSQAAGGPLGAPLLVQLPNALLTRG